MEGLWLGAGSDLVIEPGMLFNVDIWLNDGEYGLRYEDGIVVTQTGIEELTSYRRRSDLGRAVVGNSVDW